MTKIMICKKNENETKRFWRNRERLNPGNRRGTRHRFPDRESGFFARSNEACVDRMVGGRRVLAYKRTSGRLDTYGECRDSHKLQSSEVNCLQDSLQYLGLWCKQKA